MGAGIDNAVGILLPGRVTYTIKDMLDAFSIDMLVTGGQGAAAAIQINPDGSGAIVGKTAATNREAVGASSATDKNIRFKARANGTPRICDVAALNWSGLLVTTANDGVEFYMPPPPDLDRFQPIGVRCLWTSEAAAVGARDITWAVKYKVFTQGTVLAAPATALDTTITAQAPTGTSKAFEVGNRGIINAKSIAASTRMLGWQILMSAFNGAFTENKYLLGLELDYTRRLWATGPGKGRRATRPAVLEANVLGDR